MDRLQEKHSLFTKLGALIGPLQRLVDYPEQYDEQESAQAVARYCDEYPRLASEFLTFSSGVPGHDYSIQYERFYLALRGIKEELIREDPLEAVLPRAVSKAQAAIDAVPIPPASVILEAGSPFTAYCRLRELCEIDATLSLVWLDAYMGSSIFHRFLSAVRDTVSVTLVTCEPKPIAGKRDKQRWAEFLDISRLYAQERTPTTYRLLLQSSLHDRWIVLDNKRIYSLGGSAKDAGNRDYFTISNVDASPGNHAAIDELTTSGKEMFGPDTPTHA